MPGVMIADAVQGAEECRRRHQHEMFVAMLGEAVIELRGDLPRELLGGVFLRGGRGLHRVSSAIAAFERALRTIAHEFATRRAAFGIDEVLDLFEATTVRREREQTRTIAVGDDDPSFVHGGLLLVTRSHASILPFAHSVSARVP